MDEHERLFRRIGEFVVCFQWLESKFREIGWLICDPDRTKWPPKSLRNETNHDLLKKVHSLFVGLVDDLEIDDADERKNRFSKIIAACHKMRRYRNKLLHSAYIELNGGGDDITLMRSNPKLRYDPESGEPEFDQEIVSEAGILEKLEETVELIVAVNLHHTQLIHWSPFDRKPKRE